MSLKQEEEQRSKDKKKLSLNDLPILYQRRSELPPLDVEPLTVPTEFVEQYLIPSLVEHLKKFGVVNLTTDSNLVASSLCFACMKAALIRRYHQAEQYKQYKTAAMQEFKAHFQEEEECSSDDYNKDVSSIDWISIASADQLQHAIDCLNQEIIQIEESLDDQFIHSKTDSNFSLEQKKLRLAALKFLQKLHEDGKLLLPSASSEAKDPLLVEIAEQFLKDVQTNESQVVQLKWDYDEMEQDAVNEKNLQLMQQLWDYLEKLSQSAQNFITPLMTSLESWIVDLNLTADSSKILPDNTQDPMSEMLGPDTRIRALAIRNIQKALQVFLKRHNIELPHLDLKEVDSSQERILTLSKLLQDSLQGALSASNPGKPRLTEVSSPEASVIFDAPEVKGAQDAGGTESEGKIQEDDYYSHEFKTEFGTFGVHVVCDGIGGTPRGDLASKEASTFFVEEFVTEIRLKIKELQPGTTLSEVTLDQVIKMVLKRTDSYINRLICDGSDKKARQPGTTLVAALEYCTSLNGERKLAVTNVGDSRAYLLDPDGRGRQLTNDHSQVQEEFVDKGIVTLEKARLHPLSNIVTNCLGAGVATGKGVIKNSNFNPLTVEIHHLPVKAGSVVFLTTDGVHKSFAEADLFNKMKEASGNLELGVEDLVKLAVEESREIFSGGADNATVLAVKFKAKH